MITTLAKQTLSFTPYLQNEIFTIEGCLDYREFRELLTRTDELLRLSGIEADYVEQWVKGLKLPARYLKSVGVIAKQQEHASRAIRCTILRVLMGCDYRELSVRLSDSVLLRWFIGLGDLRQIPSPSKSTLERYEKQVPEEVIRGLTQKLIRLAGEPEKDGHQVLGLAQEVKLDTYFLDMTCVKGMIHFPVDWVLLRDAVRTLVKAMKLIRVQGLKHRMPEPEVFLKSINQQSMAMSLQARRKDSKKNRKRILRNMKKIARTVEAHATRYRDLLDRQWENTEWTRPAVEVILKRMDSVLEQLPDAIRQAHERIIGERPVDNGDKILSMYEHDMNVVVRGKAGAAVEFGNTLRLGEVVSGLIIDWKLYQNQAPADSHVAMEGLNEVQKQFPGKIKTLVMDRGGDSKANVKTLEVIGVENGICPRNPQKLSEKMKDGTFRQWQTRRAQTEARIGIFKNCFLGRPFRSKGFEHRELLVSWGVLVHNLWVIARMEKIRKEDPDEELLEVTT